MRLKRLTLTDIERNCLLIHASEAFHFGACSDASDASRYVTYFCPAFGCLYDYDFSQLLKFLSFAYHQKLSINYHRDTMTRTKFVMTSEEYGAYKENEEKTSAAVPVFQKKQSYTTPLPAQKKKGYASAAPDRKNMNKTSATQASWRVIVNEEVEKVMAPINKRVDNFLAAVAQHEAQTHLANLEKEKRARLADC